MEKKDGDRLIEQIQNKKNWDFFIENTADIRETVEEVIDEKKFSVAHRN